MAGPADPLPVRIHLADAGRPDSVCTASGPWLSPRLLALETTRGSGNRRVPFRDAAVAFAIRYLTATDGEAATNEVILEYLERRLTPDDTVYLVHSLRGDSEDAGLHEDQTDVVVDSRETLEDLEDRLGSIADVETHQLVRGNDPETDVMQFAGERDVDEIVVGVRQRSTAERALFGSTAQAVLLNAERPVAALPLP